MKKLLLVFVILSICLTACVSGNNPNENENTGEEAIVSQNSSDLATDINHDQNPVVSGNSSDLAPVSNQSQNSVVPESSSNSEQSGNSSTTTVSEEPPPNTQMVFRYVDELIEWINNTDADDAYDNYGTPVYYKNALTSLKKCEGILVPTFANSNIESYGIVVSSDDERGFIGIEYNHFAKAPQNRMIWTYVKPMDETRSKQVKAEGISSYLASQYGDKFKNESVLEAEISTQDTRSGATIKQTVQYVKTVDVRPSGTAFSKTYFLLDGFEVSVLQQQDKEDNRALSELVLQTVSLDSATE